MKLNKLSLKDRPLFERYLNFRRHELCSFSFENIYIWRALFEINWILASDNLCVFFKDKTGCFMYLPALGKGISPSAIRESFAVMDRFNANKEISRIENIEEGELDFYQNQGLVCRPKYPEYVYLSNRLCGLRGNDFKSQRASCNYFSGHYRCSIRSLAPQDREPCADLFKRWMNNRKAANSDSVYCGMLSDSKRVLEGILKDYKSLRMQGIVVELGGKIEGFTLGFRLNSNTFCILYEVTELSVKGLAQFIFRCFCQGLAKFKYINAMDDSGLESLRRVKLSYRPYRIIQGYIADRK